VPAVIAISPPIDRKIVPFPISKFRRFSKPGRLFLNEYLIRHLLSRVLSKQDLVTDETVKAYSYPYLDDGSALRSFILASEVIRSKENPSFIKDIKSNLLFVWGAKDRVVPVRITTRIQKLSSEAKLEIHPTAGHHPMEDEPKWLAEVSEKFLSRLSV
ncbi:MAG: alpha/beta hydrolase, partial [Bdellovibrionales bacterium]|nr:alpha/beta hydrolase [Bdellovibrionales bacterium]